VIEFIKDFYRRNDFPKNRWKDRLSRVLEKDDEFEEFKKEKFSFLKFPSAKQIIWHVINDDLELHYCSECGKNVEFNEKFFYPQYCSRSCTASGSAKKISKNERNEIVEKSKKTSLEKYGETFFSKTSEGKEKVKKTCIERYGCEYPMQNEEIQRKQFNSMVKTNIEKYGSCSTLSLPFVREKQKNTLIEKYGVDHPTKSPVILEKRRKTCIERYGVDSYTKTEEYKERQAYSEWGNKYYDYILPSGEIIRIQGYEKYAIDELLLTYEEKDLVLKNTEKPKISYYFREKKRVYLLDIFIPRENRIIEVKSTYTYHLDQEMNFEKARECVRRGYLFEFWIISRNGSIEKTNFR
jgi:hypothetical protein